ncbi:hypothetical protein V8V91_07985 [Algoriphagus halophilus]|uniref:hypothetical protein n=1 Tax=Algoriphagus halophilus TaxID=226505 RepID=UPI00358FB0F3
MNVFAQSGFPYCETFDSKTTQPTTIFGADAQLVDGALRLTNNQVDQRGYVYIDIPFSSAYGIKTSFEFFSYGGDGADGLAFFLFDANVPSFSIGGFGGLWAIPKDYKSQGLQVLTWGWVLMSLAILEILQKEKQVVFQELGQVMFPIALSYEDLGMDFPDMNLSKGKELWNLDRMDWLQISFSDQFGWNRYKQSN